jgi:hypothetical protein
LTFGSPYSQKQINAAVDHCARVYFNTSLDSFDPSQKRYNGTFNGTDHDASSGNTNVTVVNDVNSFTMKQLGDLYRVRHPDYKGGLHGLTRNFTVPGFSPYRNYTASNLPPGANTLAGVPAFEDVQIFELGKWLNRIKPDNNLPANIEPGQAFEDCVGAMLKAHIGGWK